MKKSTSIGIALLSCASLALGQDDKRDDKKDDKARGQGTVNLQDTKKDPCFLHKQSDVMGADVRNPQDENLGEIEELVINPESGEIEYAVLSFGGFLGMGDKLFALPWSVLTPVHDSDDDKKFFLLSVDKEQLKKSPGFPKDNWPDMSSPEWAKSIHDFYANDVRARAGASTPEPKAGKAIDASKRFHLVKASDVKGCDVDTSDGSDAGEISDLAIDPNRGRVAFLVLSEGGFLGFGTDKYLLPWQAAGFTVDEGKDLHCKLNVPKAKFEKAPAFKDDDWKQMADPVYVERAYTYYGYPIYWKDTVEAGARKD